jgi:opacity protein-like surface antigen
MKSFLIVTALAVASLSIAAASTKSYEIILDTAATAGKTQLTAGHYKVKVNGNVAEFLNTDTSTRVTVPVKIETTKTKSDVTSVDTKTENGVSQIQSIELRNSNSKLEF